MTPSSKEYFSNLGIDVEFNTLGRNDTLIQAYISNTQSLVDTTESKASEHVKYGCYSLFYAMTDRPKFTGFENFRVADRQFRIETSPQITEPQVKHAKITDKQPNGTNFKSTLVSSFTEYTKPIILYLSGGIDSELVANALLESGKSFTPVIFKWTDGTATQNDAEFQYALDFCTAHSLTPILKTVDIPALWVTNEFKQLAIDTQILSTQLATHAYMVKLINAELPNHQHLFGGEVRYRTNFVKDDSSLANVILLIKVAPGYDGAYYDKLATSNTASSVSLNYQSGGTWSVSSTGAGTLSGAPLSGTWTTTPGVSYEYQIFSVNLVQGSTSRISPSGPTGWIALVGNQICRAFTNSGSLTSSSAEFQILVRKVGDTTPVMASAINLSADNT